MSRYVPLFAKRMYCQNIGTVRNVSWPHVYILSNMSNIMIWQLIEDKFLHIVCILINIEAQIMLVLDPVRVISLETSCLC